MTTFTGCANANYVSFPLQNSISDLTDYYKKITMPTPNISSTFAFRNTPPSYNDATRLTGELDEKLNAMSLTYNGNTYIVNSVQITLPTHTSWLIVDPNNPRINKLDCIVTLENDQEEKRRFVIIVVPLLLDTTLTHDNDYLSGLSKLTNDPVYSLASIFTGLNDFFYYTTCLEPIGYTAFVYVNKDGVGMTQTLYTTLLSVWTNQDIYSIQTKINDTVSPIKNSITSLVKNISTLTDLTQIQDQVNQIQAVVQTPQTLRNPIVETWPKYRPPYDIILNVPVKIVTQNEGFQNRNEGFEIGSTSTGGLVVTTTTTSSGGFVSETVDYTPPAPAPAPATVESPGINILSNTTILKYFIPFISILVVLALLFFFAIPYFFANHYKTAMVQPTNVPNVGFYAISAVIVGFIGFLIGAAVNNSS